MVERVENLSLQYYPLSHDYSNNTYMHTKENKIELYI